MSAIWPILSCPVYREVVIATPWFYFIISTTCQKIGDLFGPVIYLDFRTVCRARQASSKGVVNVVSTIVDVDSTLTII